MPIPNAVLLFHPRLCTARSRRFGRWGRSVLVACPSGRTGTRPIRQSVALGACASTAGLGLYRRRLRSSAAPTGGSVDDAWPAPRARRCRVRRGSGLFYPPRHRPGPGCFPRPGCRRPNRRG